jgi:hypothetical protein
VICRADNANIVISNRRIDYDRLLLDFDPIVILKAISILGGQKKDKRMMCSITPIKLLST